MLPDRLRSARKMKGYTQEDLAKRVNTKKQTISNYETGYSTPNTDMLKDLANVLGVTTDYLLGRDDLASRLSNVADQAKKGQAGKEQLATKNDSDIVVSENDSIYTVVARAKNFPPNKIKKLEKLLDALFDEED